MFKKFFSAFAVVAVCAIGFVACNDNNIPSPNPTQDFSAQSFLADDDSEGFDANEIFDDSEPGARIAAIDTGMQVKVRMLATTACTSGTGSVGFKYIEGSVSTPVLSGTLINTAAGFKSFSIPRAKLNVEVLKTFDKSKTYSVYMMSAAAVKAIPAVKASAVGVTPVVVAVPRVPAIPAQYKLLLSLPANPAAEKKFNKALTKRIGRPITTAVTTLACPN